MGVFCSLTLVDSPVLGLGVMSGLREQEFKGYSASRLVRNCLGSVLGCAVFNASVSDLEEIAECSLKFPDNRTWKGAVSVLAYRHLESWGNEATS